MDALIAIAQDAPLSTILVLGGFIFLILALGGRLKGGLEIPPHRQKWSALIGSVLVCVGVGLYFIMTAPRPVSSPPGEHDEPTPMTPASAEYDDLTPTTPASTQTLTPDIHSDNLIEMARGWPVVFADTFDNDKGVWWTGNAKDEWTREKRRIADGQYIWELEILQDDVFAWHAPPLQTVSDLYVTVRAQQSGETVLLPTYGIVFRQTGDDFYAFTIREDGYFRCRLHQDGAWTTLLGWEESAAIRPGTVNELMVAADGVYFAFAINGRNVGSVSDNSLENGNVGFIVALGKAGDSAVFTFDDFELRARAQ